MFFLKSHCRRPPVIRGAGFSIAVLYSFRCCCSLHDQALTKQAGTLTGFSTGPAAKRIPGCVLSDFPVARENQSDRGPAIWLYYWAPFLAVVYCFPLRPERSVLTTELSAYQAEWESNPRLVINTLLLQQHTGSYYYRTMELFEALIRVAKTRHLPSFPLWDIFTARSYSRSWCLQRHAAWP